MPSNQKTLLVQLSLIVVTALVSVITVKTTLQDELKFAKERNDIAVEHSKKVDQKIDKIDDKLDVINSRLGQIEGRFHITR